MDQLRRRPDGEPILNLDDTLPLEAVRTELEGAERLAQTVRDLTRLLEVRLAPDEFRLVWALRDAVEQLALADELLRRAQLANVLARYLPPSAPAHVALRRQIFADELASDELS